MPVFVSPLAYRWLLAALLLHSMPVVCETPLHSFSATYSVRSGGLKIGRMQRRLTIAPENHYRFESKIESTGLLALVHGSFIEETSEGDLIAGQIRPRHYAYRRVTKDKRKESTITFDWEHSRITTIAKGEPSDITALPGALDKLVYQLALMQDLVRENKVDNLGRLLGGMSPCEPTYMPVKIEATEGGVQGAAGTAYSKRAFSFAKASRFGVVSRSYP